MPETVPPGGALLAGAAVPGDVPSDAFLDDSDVREKRRIMHAVDRSLDQITVTELCARAGISR